MGVVKSFRDLIVWQKSMDLVAECYRLTDAFPAREIYGLSSQLRRAAVSIPANISEGYGRQHRREYVQFLSVAAGSLAELETHLLLAERLKFASRQDLGPAMSQLDEVSRMLHALIRSLKPAADSNP